MFVVTNRIKVKKGFAERLAPNFTKGETLKNFTGFVKTEVAISKDFEEYDEMSVNMYWESLDGFHEWKNSDAFKNAHKRPEPKEGETPKESPMLGSKIVISEIVSSTEK
ncbi:heme oxygenase [Kurthia sibirica]|uniref:Heme oxygenase n=1 Tax=Kurthia sibirica TaxID=202750 RepID=A0A2U3AQE3_9BACL|nr:heme oxygenase [Kurthia sibirica]PWI26675.1 heme oxygenase [Kurthia sibirica]GEK32941.1 heme oxygenase (staphylobilin-producing) [Kurthia sibirica]